MLNYLQTSDCVQRDITKLHIQQDTVIFIWALWVSLKWTCIHAKPGLMDYWKSHVRRPDTVFTCLKFVVKFRNAAWDSVQRQQDNPGQSRSIFVWHCHSSHSISRSWTSSWSRITSNRRDLCAKHYITISNCTGQISYWSGYRIKK